MNNESVRVTWLAHACFRLEYRGWSAVIDPYKDGSVPGCGPVRQRAGAVYCTHGHGDHSAAENVTLTGEKAPADCALATAVCPHDDANGAKRGMNTVHAFTFGDLRVVHMGDVGCMPDEDVLSLARGCDLLLLPVGGFFTVGPEEALAIVKEIGPRAVVPMHYRSESPAFGYDVIGTVEPFAAGFEGPVSRPESSELVLTKDGPRGLVILRPALAE